MNAHNLPPQPMISGRGEIAQPNFSNERPIYVYELPAAHQKKYNIKTVGIIELTAEEELMATKRANNNPIRLAYELAKESLRSVDGRPVNTGDGSADLVWNRMGAPVRTMIMSAYGDLHNPTEENLADFMKSRQVQVG